MYDFLASEILTFFFWILTLESCTSPPGTLNLVKIFLEFHLCCTQEPFSSHDGVFDAQQVFHEGNTRKHRIWARTSKTCFFFQKKPQEKLKTLTHYNSFQLCCPVWCSRNALWQWNQVGKYLKAFAMCHIMRRIVIIRRFCSYRTALLELYEPAAAQTAYAQKTINMRIKTHHSVKS